eukprot:1182563-Prorocentrum_minimum.AAC.1
MPAHRIRAGTNPASYTITPLDLAVVGYQRIESWPVQIPLSNWRKTKLLPLVDNCICVLRNTLCLRQSFRVGALGRLLCPYDVQIPRPIQPHLFLWVLGLAGVYTYPTNPPPTFATCVPTARLF